MGRRNASRRLNATRLTCAAVSLALAPTLVCGAEPEAQAARADPGFGRSVWSLLFRDDAERPPWRMGPWRWTANVGFEQLWSRSEEGTRRNQSVEFAHLNAATFIGEPWLVQVLTNLGIAASQQHASYPNDLAAYARRDRDRHIGLTGGATASVFPASRFPFTASFQVSDSRVSETVTASDYTSQILSMRQSYQSPLGDQIYTGTFDRSVLNSSSYGRDAVTSLGLTAQRTFPGHLFHGSGLLSTNARSRGGGSDIGRIFARHSYVPEESLLSVESMASFTATDFDLEGGGGYSSRYLQFSSFGTWRPAEESPLFVAGAVRYFDAAIGGGSAQRSIGANASASYALSPRANVVASLGVLTLDGELQTFQSLAGTYSSEPIAFTGGHYSWGASASAANQTGGLEKQHALAASANHQVGRTFAFSSGAFSLAASQSLGVVQEAILDATRTLSHTASASAQIRTGDATDFYVSLNVGDARSRGGREEDFQLVNVQASGVYRVGAHSQVSANLTVQGVRSVQPRLEHDDPGFRVVRSGNVSYHHNRLFSVPRLRLIASATFNDLQLDSRLLGDTTALRDEATRLYETRLEYQIGRLEFRLGMRLADFNGRRDEQLFFRVTRQLGFF